MEWNTLNNIDGKHKIKVKAIDEYDREFTDEREVIVRNLKINLKIRKKSDNSYTFRFEFVEINTDIENPKSIEVEKYVIYRSDVGSDFEEIDEFGTNEIKDGSYKYYDKEIGDGAVYTYKIIAYDKDGNILSVSEEKSI